MSKEQLDRAIHLSPVTGFTLILSVGIATALFCNSTNIYVEQLCSLGDPLKLICWSAVVNVKSYVLSISMWVDQFIFLSVTDTYGHWVSHRKKTHWECWISNIGMTFTWNLVLLYKIVSSSRQLSFFLSKVFRERLKITTTVYQKCCQLI